MRNVNHDKNDPNPNMDAGGTLVIDGYEGSPLHVKNFPWPNSFDPAEPGADKTALTVRTGLTVGFVYTVGGDQ